MEFLYVCCSYEFLQLVKTNYFFDYFLPTLTCLLLESKYFGLAINVAVLLADALCIDVATHLGFHFGHSYLIPFYGPKFNNDQVRGRETVLR
jgi:hypothetical protein